MQVKLLQNLIELILITCLIKNSLKLFVMVILKTLLKQNQCIFHFFQVIV